MRCCIAKLNGDVPLFTDWRDDRRGACCDPLRQHLQRDSRFHATATCLLQQLKWQTESCGLLKATKRQPQYVTASGEMSTPEPRGGPNGSFYLTADSFISPRTGDLTLCSPAILLARISANSHSLQMYEHLTINHSNISMILACADRECIMYALTKGPYCKFSAFS